MDSEQEKHIRLRIRQMLEIGEMPCDEPNKVWAGRGNGSHCAACGDAIALTEIEYEVAFRGSPPGLRLHMACHVIWREECEPEPVT
jgi:hypothetical protein